MDNQVCQVGSWLAKTGTALVMCEILLAAPTCCIFVGTICMAPQGYAQRRHLGRGAGARGDQRIRKTAAGPILGIHLAGPRGQPFVPSAGRTRPICLYNATPVAVASHKRIVGGCQTSLIPGDHDCPLRIWCWESTRPPGRSPEGVSAVGCLSIVFRLVPGEHRSQLCPMCRARRSPDLGTAPLARTG